jgi:predicted HTH transcriptional regulator
MKDYLRAAHSYAFVLGIPGISNRAVLKQIDKLKKSGILRRIGPAKGGHWEVQ